MVVLLAALARTWMPAGSGPANDAFKLPPYPLRMTGGGNCVWLAWEMAWQNWGICLPLVGHAGSWPALDGINLRQHGKIYKLQVNSEPVESSIMILPARLSDRKTHSLLGGYGHAAWVTRTDFDSVTVLESTIFPNGMGQRWRGCWYQENTYHLSALSSASYLYPIDITDQIPVMTPRSIFSCLTFSGPSSETALAIAEDMWSYTKLSLQLFLTSLARPPIFNAQSIK